MNLSPEHVLQEDPPAGYKRLAPGRVVRLRHAGCIRCDDVVRGLDGAVCELRCSLVPGTLGGGNPVGDKVSVEQFKPGDNLVVTGISKGKGFQGVVKRHHFRGGAARPRRSENRPYDRIYDGQSPGRGAHRQN